MILNDHLRLRKGLIAALCGLIFLFYFWTALSSTQEPLFQKQYGSYYSLLSSSFIHGNLDLPVKPAPELLQLRDPYDPIANTPYRFHDASLYNGKYYLYFGAVPALVLFIPCKLIGLGYPSSGLAVAIFSCFGLLFSVLLLRGILRTISGVPRVFYPLGIIALGFSNVIPFIARRPNVYEIAISAGFCFLMLALYLLFTGLNTTSHRKKYWLFLGSSTSFALAIGSRFNLLLTLLAIPLVLFYIYHRKQYKTIKELRSLICALVIPIVCSFFLLALYNKLRFDSWTEFGLSYQLAGFNPREEDSFNLSYLLPGLYYYFLSPLQIDVVFPYIHVQIADFPGTLPTKYTGLELVAGIFILAPLTVIGLLSPVLLYKLREKTKETVLLILAICGVSAALLALFTSLLLRGATIRYLVDFATPLLILSIVTLALLTATRTSHKVRLSLKTLGIACVAWGMIAGSAISIQGYSDFLRVFHPSTYRSLERKTRLFPNLVATFKGQPLIVSAYNNLGIESSQKDIGRSIGNMTFNIDYSGAEIIISSPDKRKIMFTASVTAIDPLTHNLSVKSGSSAHLYGLKTGLRQTKRITVVLHRGYNSVYLRPSTTYASQGTAKANPSAPLIRIENLRLVR